MSPGEKYRVSVLNEYGQPHHRAGVLCEFIGAVYGNLCKLRVSEENDTWPDWRTSGVTKAGDVLVEPTTCLVKV